MEYFLSPLEASKQSELLTQLQQTIENNKFEYQERIDFLGLTKSLLSYITIATINGFLIPIFDDKLSEWLLSFLEKNYSDVHNKIAA